MDAPLIVVGCGYTEKAYEKMGGHGCSVDVDLAIALDHMSLAAVAEGLGTCWIGWIRQENVRRILDWPKSVVPIALITVGLAAGEPKERPRKPTAELVIRR